MGECTPVDAFKLQGEVMVPPIKWKVVFKSAGAAAVVLERYMRGSGQTHIQLRAFENRHEHAARASANVEPDWVHDWHQQPLRQASAATEVLARAPSMDSVVIVEPQVKQEVKCAQQPASVASGRVQFVTKHAAPQAQVAAPSVPLAPVVGPPPLQQHMPEAAAQVLGAIPQGWIAYPPPLRPMGQMMHPYHGPPPPQGMYMQHPGGPPYPYGAPMGYAPAGFVPAPMPYPTYPPQF